MNLYHCQHCRADVPAVIVHGREKIRQFKNGFVARYLHCGHLAPANDNPIVIPIVAKVHLRATFGRGPKP